MILHMVLGGKTGSRIAVREDETRPVRSVSPDAVEVSSPESTMIWKIRRSAPFVLATWHGASVPLATASS